MRSKIQASLHKLRSARTEASTEVPESGASSGLPRTPLSHRMGKLAEKCSFAMHTTIGSSPPASDPLLFTSGQNMESSPTDLVPAEHVQEHQTAESTNPLVARVRGWAIVLRFVRILFSRLSMRNATLNSLRRPAKRTQKRTPPTQLEFLRITPTLCLRTPAVWPPWLPVWPAWLVLKKPATTPHCSFQVDALSVCNPCCMKKRVSFRAPARVKLHLSPLHGPTQACRRMRSRSCVLQAWSIHQIQ